MYTLSAATTLLSHSLVWALLYSLWQGALIYGLLYVLYKALPDMSARIKYNLSMGAFGALFVWFADTWMSQYDRLKGAMVYISSAGNSGAVTYTIHSAAPQTTQGVMHKLLPGMEKYYPVIMFIYCLGLAFMLLRMAVSLLQVRALKTTGISAPGQVWDGFITEWSARLNITRPVRLYLSSKVNVPMMMGAVKPVILLPIATMSHLNTEQLEAILLHELAHIKRHDYLLNMMQAIGETILFFNPFVWLLSGMIRKERELCCDDMVVASATSPLPYAKALAIIESTRIQDNTLALAATGNKHQLFHRIKRIMEMKKSNLSYGQLTLIVAAILATIFAAVMFTTTPSFAQKAKKNKAADTTTSTTKSVYKYKTITIDDKGNKTVNEQVSDEPIEKMKGGKEVSVIYSDGDSTGHKKMKKKIVVNGSTIVDIDGEYDEISKETYDAISKAMVEVDKELKNVDWNAISKELGKSLEEIKKGIDEVTRELADEKVNKEISIEIKRALEHSREAMKDAKHHLEEQKKNMEKRAAGSSTHAYAYVYSDDGDGDGGTDYEAMLEHMEKDGLIDRKGDYTVQKDKNGLFINEKKQAEDVYEKYREYLNAGSVTVKGHKGNLKITVKD